MAADRLASPALLDLLTRLSRGEADVDQVAEQLSGLGIDARPGFAAPQPHEASSSLDAQQTLPGATVDLGRQARCGFGEVIYGEGKPVELMTEIIEAQLAAGQSVLVTRLDPTAAAQLRRCFDFTHHNPVARTLRVSTQPIGPPEPLSEQAASEVIHAAVVTAGSTDLPVAAEAIETLDWMGIPMQCFEDIGVAGPQRLIRAVPRLRLASAVVVVAGMEGALPAAVSGHLAAPVFAVPTSVGYGVNLGGMTPLLGMLSSCAASVAVVNIDAGFKGGYLAGLVVGQLRRLEGSDDERSGGRT